MSLAQEQSESCGDGYTAEMNPADIETMTKENLIDRLEEVKNKLEELDAERVELSSIMMSKMTTKEELVNDYIVTKVTRQNFNKVDIDLAKEYGAVIMVEKVDTQLLKKLYKSGAKMSGVEEYTYLLIKRVES